MKRVATAFVLAAACAAVLTTVNTHGRSAPASPAVKAPSAQRGHALRPRSWYDGSQGSSGSAVGPIHPFTPTDNLPPGSGDVMITTQVFLVYWTPNNTITSTYKNLLTRFVQDLNGTPFLNIVTQYYGNNGTIQNVVTYGGSYTDTATGYDAYTSGHDGTPAHPISDDDIRKEVDHAIAANSWPTGLGNMVFVFTEKGIESCASFGCTPLVDNTYCAYHDHFTNGTERIYANMPFVNSTGWDCVNTSGEPNNTDADREISTFSHELFEAITDPRPNDTWTDNSCGGNVACGEIGDKCAYFFPNAANADGSNLTLHGNPYNVQPEWSNGTFTALGGHANDGCTHAYLPADMTISKTGPSAITAGSNFDYVIGVQSNGSPTAETPHFTDTLDSHLGFQAITTPLGWACSTPAFGVSGSIDCSKTNNTAGTDGSMDSGETASFVVTSRVAPSTPNGSIVNNTGKVAWDTLYAPNNASAASVHLSKTSSTSATVESSADLTISKTTIGSAVAGSDFNYIIDVENDGPSDAQSVTVTDTLPAGTSFVSITGSGGFTCTGPSPVTCTKSNMGTGAIASLTLTVHVGPGVANGTVITNSASVGSTTPDPNPGNNTASVPATVSTSADLAITKTGPPAPMAGTDVTYTIGVTDLGPSDAKNPVVADTVPAGTTFVSLAAPAPWTCTTPAVGTPGPAPISCTVASLSAGASATFTLVVHLSASAPDGTQLCNTASISSPTADPLGTNNSSQACGTVRTSADLSLTQSAVTSGSPGHGTATFTLTVKNNGPTDSQKIALVATSSLFTGPAPAINVSTGGTCTVGVQTVTCTWTSLALGASDTVSIAVPWKSAVGQVCDTGNLTAGTPDPNATNNTQTTCIGKK